jgi:ABC-2 type transport system ATP-binding protein
MNEEITAPITNGEKPAESAPASALEIVDLHKAYGEKQVLKGLSLRVAPGEVMGLIGKNGIGKSTTIDCVVGLKDFDAGSITILSHDIKKEPLVAKSLIGYVPSEPTAYEVMTGYEYLAFIASAYKMRQVSYVNNMEYLKAKFDLSEEDLNRRIAEYSHGMKQKICLMASLIHNPSLWILDEPTVGLDVMVYEVLVKMIREFADHGHAVLLTSHNIEMVGRLADEVAIIYDGVINTSLDFRKEPLRRRDLSNIFFHVYGERGE